MAIAVALYNEDLRACESLKRVRQPPITPLDEQNYLRSRINTLVSFWESLTGLGGDVASNHNVSITTHTGSKAIGEQQSEPRDLFRPDRGTTALDVAPPPSYEESAQDAPPDYTATDAVAVVQDVCCLHISALHGREQRKREPTSQTQSPFDVKVDFSASENVRMRAKKKKAPAAKPAAAKWFEDDEEKKEETPADDGGGDKGGAGDSGSGAGGSGGGDDGAGGGGGGGDDNNNEDDAWATAATGKKAKKTKKKQEEEEAAKKAEEEAAAAKKAEEEAAAAAAAAKAAEEAEKLEQEKAKAASSPVDVRLRTPF
jgi:hypothetical protein